MIDWAAAYSYPYGVSRIGIKRTNILADVTIHHPAIPQKIPGGGHLSNGCW